MYRYILLTIFFASTLFAKNDIYLLKYSSKDKNCTLLKNGKKIEWFDKRFKNVIPPKWAYSCQAIQKEQYNDCVILSKKNVTSMMFAYGPYEKTNLVFAFRVPVDYIDGNMTIECTKTTKKLKPKLKLKGEKEAKK